MMNAQEWYAKGQVKMIRDLPIFYLRQGHGEVLVCIHGFPSSSWDFELIWPELQTRFDVIATDLIGLGKSAKPNKPIPVSLQADVIEDLLLGEGINQAHILAHDLGDTIAQELLARLHEKSSKIKWLSCVLLNGGIFPETHQPLMIQKILCSPLGSLASKFMTERSLRRSFQRIFSPEHPPTEDFIKETWKLITYNHGKAMIPRLIRYMIERRTNRERWVTPLAENIIPIRLINGVKDPVSGRHAANRFKEIVPNADIVFLENSGHYPHVETPQQVIKALNTFHDQLVLPKT